MIIAKTSAKGITHIFKDKKTLCGKTLKGKKRDTLNVTIEDQYVLVNGEPLDRPMHKLVGCKGCLSIYHTLDVNPNDTIMMLHNDAKQSFYNGIKVTGIIADSKKPLGWSFKLEGYGDQLFYLRTAHQLKNWIFK
jgi:hypothetical protein